MAEHTFPETTVSPEQPLAVELQNETLDVNLAAVDYDYKVSNYTDVAAYQAGLAVEVAAGWHPIATTNFLAGVGDENLIVTYRKVAA